MRGMSQPSSSLLSFIVPVVFAIGCGGSAAPAGDAHTHEHGHEHGKLAAPLHEFHEVLAPLWHSEKGPEREKKVCAAAATLESKATATGDQPIVAAVAGLKAECGKAEGARADFEPKFSAVHDAFHHAAEPGGKVH